MHDRIERPEALAGLRRPPTDGKTGLGEDAFDGVIGKRGKGDRAEVFPGETLRLRWRWPAIELGPDAFDLALKASAILVGDAVGEAYEQRHDPGDGPAVAFERLDHIPECVRSRSVFDAVADHLHGVGGDGGVIEGAGSAAASSAVGDGEFLLEALGRPYRQLVHLV